MLCAGGREPRCSSFGPDRGRGVKGSRMGGIQCGTGGWSQCIQAPFLKPRVRHGPNCSAITPRGTPRIASAESWVWRRTWNDTAGFTSSSRGQASSIARNWSTCPIGHRSRVKIGSLPSLSAVNWPRTSVVLPRSARHGAGEDARLQVRLVLAAPAEVGVRERGPVVAACVRLGPRVRDSFSRCC